MSNYGHLKQVLIHPSLQLYIQGGVAAIIEFKPTSLFAGVFKNVSEVFAPRLKRMVVGGFKKAMQKLTAMFDGIFSRNKN